MGRVRGRSLKAFSFPGTCSVSHTFQELLNDVPSFSMGMSFFFCTLTLAQHKEPFRVVVCRRALSVVQPLSAVLKDPRKESERQVKVFCPPCPTNPPLPLFLPGCIPSSAWVLLNKAAQGLLAQSGTRASPFYLPRSAARKRGTKGAHRLSRNIGSAT